MKRLLLLTLTLLVAVSVGSAAPLCTTTSLDVLIGYGSVGCTSQGLTFSNFAISDGNSFLNSSVQAQLQAYSSGGQFFDNWIFSKTGTFTTGFTLSYTVTVTPGNALSIVQLVQTKDQINTGFTPNGITASDLEPGVTPFPIMLKGTSPAEETFQSNPYGLGSLTTTTTITVPAGNVLSYEQDFTSESPEPVSFILIGSGLIGLAFLRRRMHKG
jgi:hypothetical protein